MEKAEEDGREQEQGAGSREPHPTATRNRDPHQQGLCAKKRGPRKDSSRSRQDTDCRLPNLKYVVHRGTQVRSTAEGHDVMPGMTGRGEEL